MPESIPLSHALSALSEADKIVSSSLTFKKSKLDDFLISFRTTIPEWMFKQLNFVYLSETKLPKIYHEGPDRTFKNLIASILKQETTDPVTYFFGQVPTSHIGQFFKIKNLEEAKGVIQSAFKTVFDPLRVNVELVTDEQNQLFIRFTK